MNKLLLISLIALMSCAGGCSRNDDTAMTDAALENEIAAKVMLDPELSTANLLFEADAELNAATISGTVESEALRTRAVDLARSARPKLVILDKIDVKPRQLSRDEFTEEHAREERERAKERKERIGTSIDDAWIHSGIVTKLTSDSNTSAQNIKVDVSRGVVTLRGIVDSAKQKSDASEIAKQTAGVKRVNNVMTVPKGS